MQILPTATSNLTFCSGFIVGLLIGVVFGLFRHSGLTRHAPRVSQQARGEPER
jgi:hypothetical protein